MDPIRDRLEDFAGPQFTPAELRGRVATLSFEAASFLRPDNVIAIFRHPDLAYTAKEFYRKPLLEHRTALAAALDATGQYPSAVIEAVAQVPRHLLVPTRAAALAYWNGPNLVSGTLALPAPWLAAYVATRMQIERDSRVLVFGFGRGYCSLLFAHLVGAGGQIVAVELEPESITRGRSLIEHLGLRNVTVVYGDALATNVSLGAFDCVWASLSSGKIPHGWFGLLTEGGRLGVFTSAAVEPAFGEAAGLWANSCQAASGLSPWWTDVSFKVLKREDRVVCKSQMPGLVNPPFSEGSEAVRDPGTVEFYPGLLEKEQALLRLLLAE